MTPAWATELPCQWAISYLAAGCGRSAGRVGLLVLMILVTSKFGWECWEEPGVQGTLPWFELRH
jgi:hypothetical protein